MSSQTVIEFLRSEAIIEVWSRQKQGKAATQSFQNSQVVKLMFRSHQWALKKPEVEESCNSVFPKFTTEEDNEMSRQTYVQKPSLSFEEARSRGKSCNSSVPKTEGGPKMERIIKLWYRLCVQVPYMTEVWSRKMAHGNCSSFRKPKEDNAMNNQTMTQSLCVQETAMTAIWTSPDGNKKAAAFSENPKEDNGATKNLRYIIIFCSEAAAMLIEGLKSREAEESCKLSAL